MQQWEYLTVDVDWKKDAAPLLNDYGKGGWELVAVICAIVSVGSTWQHKYMMKRLVVVVEK